MNWKTLFTNHISTMNQRLEKVCNDLGVDSVVIGSGSSQYFFEDDQDLPFRSNHHFAHWCPHPGQGHLLQLKPGEKPKLLVYQPDDFWSEHQSIQASDWTESFEIQEFTDPDKIWQALEKSGRTVYHGPDVQLAEAAGLDIDAQELLPRLNWNRSFKTEYEVACITEATQKAAKAHESAEDCFRAGGSELDIHFAYLQSLRSLDRQLPYESIVCLNEKAAILHYPNKRDHVRHGMSLLIDSGAAYRGYACDITRTYASDKAPALFHELLESMQKLQQKLCKMVKIGFSMADIHYQSHLSIANTLLEFGIIKNISAEDAVKEGISASFYPHGVGHMLGLLVHDVAGKQIDETGRQGEPDHRFPKLRSVRKLLPGNLVTIEPGVYFIDSLLKQQESGNFNQHFDWDLIASLRSCGGIRIEDNVLVTDGEALNITREFLGDRKN
ncbi:MAG: Xaa-Pro dipeptidase [Oligoflexus sp.]